MQLLFLQIVVDSLLDPKVGIIYDPKSLIRALAELIERYMKSQVNGLIDTR
jgi:cathepsin L